MPMSKAVTREPEGDDDLDAPAPNALPRDFRNYITPAGLQRLLDEAAHLWKVERPKLVETVAWAASNGDRSENGDYIYGKRRLREIDRRIRFLTKRLDIAEIVDPLRQGDNDQVFFGARVTVADADGNENTYTIVGVDEADVVRGRISWISPLARALIKAREGDSIRFQSPVGVREIDIVGVVYERIE